MGGCFFNYLIKVTPHCVVLCLNRPFLSDERPVCMFPRSPLLRQRPNPPPPLPQPLRRLSSQVSWYRQP